MGASPMSGGIERPMSAREIDALSRGLVSPTTGRRLCSVPGCERRHWAGGKCAVHHNLARRAHLEAFQFARAARRCPCGSVIATNTKGGVCAACRIYKQRHGVERIGGRP